MATAAARTEPTGPLPYNSKRCPVCRRPYWEDPANLTERVLRTSRNHLIRFRRLHDYTGAGGVPALSDRLIRWLIGERPLTRVQMEIAVDVLTEFCAGRERLGAVVIGHVFEGLSLRALAAELGIDDHTVATMVKHGHLILKQLCAEAGIRPLGEST